MYKSIKQCYTPPRVLQETEVLLERNLLGSVVEQIYPVETAGQEIEGFFDSESDGTSPSTFNHTWGD